MIAVNPKHNFSFAGTEVAVYHANVHEGLPRHEHKYAHATLCAAGSCVVRKEGKELVLNKSSKPVYLVADEWHEIEALEDGTVFINVFVSQSTP